MPVTQWKLSWRGSFLILNIHSLKCWSRNLSFGWGIDCKEGHLLIYQPRFLVHLLLLSCIIANEEWKYRRNLNIGKFFWFFPKTKLDWDALSNNLSSPKISPLDAPSFPNIPQRIQLIRPWLLVPLHHRWLPVKVWNSFQLYLQHLGSI